MSTPINAAYFTQLTAQVNEAPNCAQLQAIVTPAMQSILAMEASATAQLAIITAQLGLLTPPTNLAQVITFIQTLIASYLTPQLVPAVTLAAQLTATVVAIAALTAAINAKAAQFASCSITIPT